MNNLSVYQALMRDNILTRPSVEYPWDLGVLDDPSSMEDPLIYVRSSKDPRCVFVLAPKLDGYANEQLRRLGRAQVAVYFLYCRNSRDRARVRAGSLLLVLPTNYG